MSLLPSKLTNCTTSMGAIIRNFVILYLLFLFIQFELSPSPPPTPSLLSKLPNCTTLMGTIILVFCLCIIPLHLPITFLFLFICQFNFCPCPCMCLPLPASHQSWPIVQLNWSGKQQQASTNCVWFYPLNFKEDQNYNGFAHFLKKTKIIIDSCTHSSLKLLKW